MNWEDEGFVIGKNRFRENAIILDTGGWFTPTTKTRMNQTSNAFGLGFQVYQKNYEWFADYNGKTYEFTKDHLSLKRN